MQAFIKRKKTVRGAGTPKPVAKKNVTTLVNKLDKIFSLYIRKRDAMPYGGRYFKCISCGRVLPFEQADCGHFWSRRHMATRFDEDNCNAECKGCNRFDGDHLLGYQANLIKKIGQRRYDILNYKNTTSRSLQFSVMK